jgi:hypothetical protein
MLVTLGEGSCGAEDLSAGRKNVSFFHDGSGEGGAEGGGAGAEAAGLGGLRKSCVKLPSADAEAPGDENPLDFDGPGEGGAGRGAGSVALPGGAYGAALPETKIRVNSPGPCSGGAWDPCATGGGASRPVDGWGADGRCPSELNICVNSPGPGPDCEDGGAGPVTSPAAVRCGPSANGFASCGAPSRSVSKAFRNIAVALRGSASGSGLELEFLSVMGRRS